MTTQTVSDTSLEKLLAPAEGLAGGSGRLASLRAEAASALEGRHLPGPKDEEWRFVNLTPLKDASFARAGVVKVSHEQLSPFFLPEAGGSRLVFVNGVYAPELSSVSGLGEGVTLGTLAEASSGLVEARLGTLATYEQEVFTGLNTRYLTDGALLTLASDTGLAAPVHLLFVSAPQAEPVAVYPRVLVVAGVGASATIVEDYVTLPGGSHFTDAVSELFVGDSANVRHVRVQREGAEALHIGRAAVSLGRDCTYQATTLNFGARLSRLTYEALQTAEGVNATLFGLTLIDGQQESDTHTLLDHAKPNGHSEQLNKCVVGGSAHAVFNGKVLVRKDAQLTDSAQSSRNLLLTDKARVDTKPQLEIFADDVKCSHGATVGQLETEELFYLRSRGLSEENARKLLIYAFAAEIVERVPVASLRERLEAAVTARTTGNEA